MLDRACSGRTRHPADGARINVEQARRRALRLAGIEQSDCVLLVPRQLDGRLKLTPGSRARLMPMSVRACGWVRLEPAQRCWRSRSACVRRRQDRQRGDQTQSRVILTRGVAGAVAWHKPTGQIEVAAPTVKVADTMGAGDSFQAALRSRPLPSPRDSSWSFWRKSYSTSYEGDRGS